MAEINREMAQLHYSGNLLKKQNTLTKSLSSVEEVSPRKEKKNILKGLKVGIGKYMNANRSKASLSNHNHQKPKKRKDSAKDLMMLNI